MLAVLLYFKQQAEVETLTLISISFAPVGGMRRDGRFKEFGFIEVWIINRIIKRNNLVKKPKIFEKRNRLYPY